MLVRLGAARFAATGTHDDPGTMLVTISGAVARPGVVELPSGTPLSILLTAAGATAYPAAVVTGGYHGTWIAPDPAHLVARTGIVIVLDHSTCSLGELGRVAAWLAAESAKQCGPCRFGLPALAPTCSRSTAATPAGSRPPPGTRKRWTGAAPARTPTAPPGSSRRGWRCCAMRSTPI